MDDSNPRSLPVPSNSGRRLFAYSIAVLVMGFAVYVSYSPVGFEPRLVAEDTKEKKPATTTNAVAAANAFLDKLDAKQRQTALLAYDSDKKPNWSNLPVSFVPRNGVKLGDLTKEQREKAMGLLAAVFSKEGYQKMIDIMDSDQQLVDNPGKGGGKAKGGDKGPMFGKDLYFLAIFGEPSETKPWMVQFGGHHLGVNVTVIGKHFILTPSHTGTQPALFKRGEMQVRPLGRESDTAYKLIDALDEKQRKVAILSEQNRNLELGPGKDGKTVESKGIKGADLTKEQQALLLEVIAAWVNIVENDSAIARMAAIKAKINDTFFAWSGPIEKGKAAYFRIQGPSVIIEYAPQGGTDHIHTIIRNPEDEYGAGLLKK